tara:strand:- start:249 stop:476 length:228 start_codon:yes stop_codon:yes gene_type:complete
MANPWTRLQNLLPRDVVQIGTSQGSNGDGTTNVALVGGGVITATGDGFTSGQKVFVQGSIIRGEAPDLTAVEIEV